MWLFVGTHIRSYWFWATLNRDTYLIESPLVDSENEGIYVRANWVDTHEHLIETRCAKFWNLTWCGQFGMNGLLKLKLASLLILNVLHNKWNRLINVCVCAKLMFSLFSLCSNFWTNIIVWFQNTSNIKGPKILNSTL